MLAKHVAQNTQAELMSRILVHSRKTIPLKEVSLSERFSILVDAFTEEHNEIQRIEGRKIVLIDDVMTSGATLSAAANALFRAEVRDISVLVLARVTENT